MLDALLLVGKLAAGFAFFGSLIYVSCCLSVRWLPDAQLGVRHAAACVILCWLLSITFSLLVAVRSFTPVLTLPVALFCAAYVRARLPSQPSCGAWIVRDVSRFCDVLLDGDRDVAWRAVLVCLLLLTALLAIRGLALPLLGWDSLTYHGLKAGLWARQGGWWTLEAPGGWEYYRSYLGGGEVFTSWAMLFLRSDLLAGLPDVGFWLLLGVAATCLARHFGASRRSSALVGAALLCAPEFSRMVGSGYVDTCANSLLLCGVLFLFRVAQLGKRADAYLAAASLGLASSVRASLLVTTALMVPVAVILLLRQRQPPRTLALCVLLYASPVVPWLLQNWASTGYLLGAIPMSIGPIHIGVPPPNLVWLLTRPDLIPYRAGSEISALYNALRPFELSLLLSLVGIPVLLTGLRNREPAHVLAAIVIAAIAVPYFSPSFTVVRLGWATASGRFLAPIVVLTAAAGACEANRTWRAQALVEGIATACVIAGIYLYVTTYILEGHRVERVFLGIAVALVVLFHCIVRKRMWWPAPRYLVSVPLLFCVLTVATAACIQLKDRLRIRAYSGCTTLHDFPRYWVPALSALNSAGRPARIAFSYGPQKVSHDAFLAPFLGAQLENDLVYVSPEADGAIIPHHPDYTRMSNPNLAAWLDALRSASATHVLCLRPACTELKWVESHPGLFRRLAGEREDWGLFRIDWPGPASGTQSGAVGLFGTE